MSSGQKWVVALGMVFAYCRAMGEGLRVPRWLLRLGIALCCSWLFLSACGEASRNSPTGAATSGGNAGNVDAAVGPVPELDAPRILAEARCARIFGCCATPKVETEAECVSLYEEHYAALHQRARDLDLTYSESCAQSLLADELDYGCYLVGEQAMSDGIPGCRSELGYENSKSIFHGDLPAGSSCTLTDDWFSDCARGLVCASVSGPGIGTCQDYGVPVEHFTVPLGSDCSAPGADCEEGSYCSSDSEVCVPTPGEGEACLGICQPRFFCSRDEPEVCVAYLAEGESCQENWMVCAATTVCDYGAEVRTCINKVELGEPCVSASDCLSSYCSEAGVCTSRPPLICTWPIPV